MKVIYCLIILLILLLANFTSAQPNKDSSSVGVYLETVTHDKKGEMWVGGSVWLLQGLLLRVSSNGVTAITPPNTETIQDIHFISPKVGLLIADYRSIHKSYDGGRTWNILADEETLSFRKISFVNEFEGWAVELNKGSLMRTIDGGKSWQEQAVLKNNNFRHVYFLNENQGWVIGDAIAYTHDGGKSWKYKKMSTKEFDFDHISFKNQSIGGATSWLMGANGKGLDIIQTFNGGKSWKPISKDWLKKITDKVYREKFPNLIQNQKDACN